MVVVTVFLAIKVILTQFRKSGKEGKIQRKLTCDPASQSQLLLVPLCMYSAGAGGPSAAGVLVFPSRISFIEASFA